MTRQELKERQTVKYKLRNSSGSLRVTQVYQDSVGSWWVCGLDKAKSRDITCRPSQCSK